MRVWERIVTIGVYDGMSPWDYKRVRLLNGIAGMATVVYLLYVLTLINSPDYVTFYLCLAYAFLTAPTLLFSYLRRYNAAAYYYILLTTLLYVFTPIAKKNDGSEYLLIANGIQPMLFLRGAWPVISLFLLNVAALFFVRYAMTVIPPFLHNPYSTDVYNVNVFLSICILFLIVYYFRTQNYRQEGLLSQQNAQLQQSLDHLKATQVQLIQSEKMASLGELTAGIAHEIQNPLNFVNNFSDLSIELLKELTEGPFQQLPAAEKEYAGELVDDLTQNLQKIHHHGGRADLIVRGMLQHSRTSTGEKRPTNLNQLADEYLKLAYHGLRAKDKEFNAELITHFGPEVGLIDAVPQDLGRVLLNLYNNAFYALSDKKKQQPADFLPTITVSTRLLATNESGQAGNTSNQKRPAIANGRDGGFVEIRVRDNGMGIPESIQQKIFQPFFTTKPAGQGTGLGLSLSYDMVTKGHGGTLSMETVEGQGTEFIIHLPVSSNQPVAA
ncbi:hypothetical protein GCM10027190_35000 [Spirosoma areae]